jgi:hypothetical protein
MTDKEESKELKIKLNEGQFLHLMVTLGDIANRLDKLEAKLVSIEAELKLIRVEMNEK